MKLKPDSAAAHFNYGTALAAAGRLDDAVAAYQRALQLRPEYAIAHNNLGTALLQLGRPSRRWRVSRSRTSRSSSGRGASECRSAFSCAWGISGSSRPVPPGSGAEPGWVTAIASLASVLAAAPRRDCSESTGGGSARRTGFTLTLRRDANTLDVLAVAHAVGGRLRSRSGRSTKRSR